MKHGIFLSIFIFSVFYSCGVSSQTTFHYERLPPLDYNYNLNPNVNPARVGRGLSALLGGVKQDLVTLSGECASGLQWSCDAANNLLELCTRNCQGEGPSFRYECMSDCTTIRYGKGGRSDNGLGYDRGSNGGSNDEYTSSQQRKSQMYECIQGCSGTGCRYLDGFARQECNASEERCKANCR